MSRGKFVPTYRRDSFNVFKQFAKLQPFLLAAGIIIIIPVLVFGSVVKNCILSFLSLALSISSGFSSDARAIINYRSILDENTQLKKQILTLGKETIQMKELLHENKRLKKILSFKEQAQFKTVAARIIARDPDNWSRGVSINKGSAQGIKAGNVVITESGLAGRVLEAFRNVSKIILINDTDSAVSALIQRSREDGLVSGTLMGQIVMRYLDKEADVTVGDIVETSGLTAGYPKSILIGEVKEVKEEPQGLAKYAFVKPAVDLRRVEEVLVIVGEK
jgi:rod shape-determining protein MreC